MMGKLQLFCSLIALMASTALGRGVKDRYYIDVYNPFMDHYPDGFWGNDEYCQAGKAFAFAIKYEQSLNGDLTKVNAVKLYCRDASGSFTGEITSLEGRYGDWLDMKICPNSDDKITGFRLRVWPYQGTFGDDWAIDNVQISCSSNTTLDGLGNPVSQEQMAEDNHKFSAQSISEHLEVVNIPIKSRSRINGDWTNWAYCMDGYYVTGLMTFGEEGIHPFSDDCGLMDMYLYCSNI